MVLPSPRKKEKREDFISRFMSSEEAKKEFPDNKQRVAVANSKWREHVKSKESSTYFTVVKVKESEDVTEDDSKVYTFIGLNTLPDRAVGYAKDGTPVKGEILSRRVLDKVAGYINDESRLGGEYGSYRTVSLFHDRVHTGDYTLEEAGFVVPGTAVVKEMEKYPGNFELLLDVKVNKYYQPTLHKDYTPEKIIYKIENDALGLSVEYNNNANQEKVVEYDGNKYNYVFDTDDFRGFGFARPNLIGNPGAVRVKEIMFNEPTSGSELKSKGENTMEEAKLKELQNSLSEANAKIKELEEQKQAAEKLGAEEKSKELKEEISKVEEKVKEIRLKSDATAAKLKESIELAFSSVNFNAPAKSDRSAKSAKIKEAYKAYEQKDFIKFKEIADENFRNNSSKLKEMFARDGSGFDFEKHQTLSVKCKGSRMVVVPTPKTKDVVDASDMAEATYSQTNAMFADRYVAGITETFLKDDSLLTAMPKEQHLGGNDQYQWRIWTDFVTVSGDNTLAVNPNVTSVSRTQRNFEKMQTPIREYRDGVEVTDFTQAHSMASVGDLLGKELQRAAEAVTQSMAADLFKGKTEASAGWVGFNGLIGYADSSTHATLFGKTRSAANRLLDATLANTYDSTSEAISVSLVREGYEKVLAHGSSLADLAIVAHPTQVRKLFDSEDGAIRYNSPSQQLVMAAAPASWGFSRAIIPHLDGIPVIRDYHCESSAAAADMFAVVDLSLSKGFVLVVSKPLGARGLAKIGTSEAAYVNFWGAAVYKSPRNVFVHDSLTV